MALNTFLIDNQLGALLNALFSRLSRFDGSKLKNRLCLRLLVSKLSILDQLSRDKRQNLKPLLLGQDTFPRWHGGTGETMRNRIEQVILPRIRSLLVVIEQGQLSARCVTDFECALVEISRSWPQTIGTWPITSTIHAVTPDTLGEIDTLSSFDHLGWRSRCQLPF
jgi:hypothetical protein